MNDQSLVVQVGLCKGTDFGDRMIEHITRSLYSHALIILPDGSVWESLPDGGVQHNPSISTQHAGEPIDIFSIAVTPKQLAAIIAFCQAHEGEPYAWKDDALFVIGGTEAADPDPGKWFCSELVFAAFLAALIELLARVPAWQNSPAMIGWSTLLTFTISTIA